MTSSLFETTIGAFEERMALRRKMLSVTGVKLPKRRIPKDVEDEIRNSIINCYECKSGDTCDGRGTTTQVLSEQGFNPASES